MTDQLATQSDIDQNNSSEPPRDPGSDVIYLSQAEAEALLDRQARKYLGMSGPEFRRQYRAGTIVDPDRTDVIMVSYLLHMADE